MTLLKTALVAIALARLSASTLTLSITDENGKSTAARVYLAGANGAPVLPLGTIVYAKERPDGISERHFIPRGGKFTVPLSPGPYKITIERGKEYLPRQIAVVIPSSGDVSRTIRLRRWIDMSARDWFSGDMHVHRGLVDLAWLLEAEDIAVAIPITRWKTNTTSHEDPDLDRFVKSADEDGVVHAGPRLFPVLNEELEPRGSALLASWLHHTPVQLEYPLASFGKEVGRAGGVSDSEKATQLELPALAAVGACSTIGLANNHLWRSGSFSGAWGAWPAWMLSKYEQTCSGFVQSGFDMYSALLNAGFALKLSAGSASGVHPVPVGWSRIYVHAPRPLTARGWFEGLRAGRSFVTTGPMLLLRVNGHEPGDEIRGAVFPMDLDIAVEMLSITPIASCEVVLNGTPHTVALERAGANSYRGHIKLAVKSSAWITARWSAPRGTSCDVAHTSPVNVWNGDQPIPARPEELRALLAAVDRLIDRVQRGDPTGEIMTSPDEIRQKTLTYLEEARLVYQRKLAQHQINSERAGGRFPWQRGSLARPNPSWVKVKDSKVLAPPRKCF